MSDASRWRIPSDAPDWECTWADDELFHLRYFRALSLQEKIRAVEQMERVAEFLHGHREASGATPRR